MTRAYSPDGLVQSGRRREYFPSIVKFAATIKRQANRLRNVVRGIDFRISDGAAAF
ncbi:hypothetical protein DFQ50_106229 [Pseudocitrobacter faecalis]|uniref:Uncharacterized protein n=1 Tax=Pseudocitrobacter faecalis TaxID=1398493 RepID=A0ABX9FXI7_9ENTR|nr:hypothetical protein DFQ50_106229 [Pseudocitrobacter faecalis]